MAVLDSREYGAHPAYDTRLLTVMDIAAAYDVMTYILLEPAVVLAAAYRITLHLRGALYVLREEIHIVLFIVIFSEGDTAAAAVRDLAVLDDPALGPVGSDHAVLVSCRRRPCGGCLVDVESGDRYVIDSVLVGHEAVSSYADLDILGIGILAAEICIYDCLVPFLFGVPLIAGFIGIPGMDIDFPCYAFFKGSCFIHNEIVDIYGTRMSLDLGKIPIAFDCFNIRIEIAEDTVADTGDPNIALIRSPVFDFLCAGDDGM